MLRHVNRICRVCRRHGRRRAALLGLALGLSVLSGAAQARTLVVGSVEEPVSLSGHWRFQPGDDPTWSSPRYDDSGWPELQVPGGWGRQGYPDHSGVAWYRLELDFSPVLAEGHEDLLLGIRLGEVTSSYELYADGQRLGGVGALPPKPRMEYDRHRIYVLPMPQTDTEGRVLLALRVWRSPISRTQEGGPMRGPFIMGRLNDLTTNALLAELPYLVLVALFAGVGIYQIRQYAEHRKLVEHLWLGLFVLDLAAYSLLRTQWKYSLSDDFVLLKNLEYAAIYVLPALGIQLFSSLFSRPVGPWLRAYQLSHVLLAVLVGLTPGLRFNLMTISLWQLWALPTIVMAGVVGFQEHRRGHPQAQLLPSLFFLATCLFDIAMDQDWVRGLRMMPVGMSVLIVSMAASLSKRLSRATSELDELTCTLEERVALQTSQLRDRAEELESKNRELEEAQERLREASLTDPLTGLSNRRFLTDYLGHDVAGVLREYAHAASDPTSPEPRDLILLVVDLDHFKAVNDHHGHDAGDRVLVQATEILRTVCRKSDFVVRWGGEEFLIVSRFVSRLGAAALAERIRTSVRQHSFDVGDGVLLQQTCSIGFASFPLLEEHPEEFCWQDVVAVADRALYVAKESGRDRWVGVSRAVGDPGDELLRRLREDFFGCLARNEIQCQLSRPDDESDATDLEKDDSI